MPSGSATTGGPALQWPYRVSIEVAFACQTKVQAAEITRRFDLDDGGQYRIDRSENRAQSSFPIGD